LALLDDLKSFNIADATVSLWVFKSPRGSADEPPIYTGHWVEITDGVIAALKETANNERNRIEEIFAYNLLAQNNETSALSIQKVDTNAGILTTAVSAETASKRVSKQKQLLNSTFYVIKLVHENSLLYAVRRTTSAWKTKRALSALSLLFIEDRLDVDERPHFDLEKSIDFFIFNDNLIILSKGHFESVLRYKEAHAADFLELQAEPAFANLFVDMGPLIEHVGVNKIRLRRVSALRQEGNYRDPAFMTLFRELHAEYGFTIQFDESGKMVVTPETGSEVLTALLDHRLRSAFSKRVYDVPSAIPVAI
jgi:hypothetical protein